MHLILIALLVLTCCGTVETSTSTATTSTGDPPAELVAPTDVPVEKESAAGLNAADDAPTLLEGARFPNEDHFLEAGCTKSTEVRIPLME